MRLKVESRGIHHQAFKRVLKRVLMEPGVSRWQGPDDVFETEPDDEIFQSYEEEKAEVHEEEE